MKTVRDACQLQSNALQAAGQWGSLLLVVIASHAAVGLGQSMRDMSESDTRAYQAELSRYRLDYTRSGKAVDEWPDYTNSRAVVVCVPAYAGAAIGGTCGFAVGFVVAPLNTMGRLMDDSRWESDFRSSYDAVTRSRQDVGARVPILPLLVGVFRWPVDGFIVGADVAAKGADLGQYCAGWAFAWLKRLVWDTPRDWFRPPSPSPPSGSSR